MQSTLHHDPAALLTELMASPVYDRLTLLRAAGNLAAVFEAICEECDRIATVEVGQGLAASELVVALADEIGDPRMRADARGVRAMALAYAARFDEALDACEVAVDIAERAGCVVAAARARLASVHPLSELDRYEQAIAAGELARAAFEREGESILAARADVSLGAVHDRRDDAARALIHYDRALPILAGDQLVAAQIESNRGVALISLDEFARAETAFAAAVAAFAANETHWAAAVAEGNLAFLATRQGRLERALHHFERARHFMEVDESPADLARLLAEQADALADLGMPAEALNVYERALPCLEIYGLALEAAQARAGFGRTLAVLGREDEAGTMLAEAAAALETLGQDVARARVDLVRAELAARRDRLDEARTLAEDALEILGRRPSDAIVAQERLARFDLEAGNLSGVEARIGVALPMAERLDIAPLRARLLHLRGLAKIARGERGDALHDLRAAVEQIERVRGVLQAERLRTAFLGSQLHIYEDAVKAAMDRDGETSVAEAFSLVERAKGRALLDVVSGTLDLVDASERPNGDPAERALLAELARLRGELNWRYSRLDESEGDPSSWLLREEWHESTRRLERELNALEDRLATARGVAGLYAPTLELDGALALVPTDTALIEYFAAGTELIAFVLLDGKVTVVRHMGHPDDLATRVSRVHFQIGRAVAGGGRPSSQGRTQRMLADVRREMSALHDLLIAPLAAAVAGARRLLIVPHGSLHALPFSALWDGDRYLVESHEIVTAPSASVLGRLATDREPAADGQEALVIGVPDELAPWIAAETHQVAALLGTTSVLGSEATAARFVAEARDARIIHLACHGRFLPDRPLASGLKLADRWLTVRDIYALRLHASLVTLSGCETGRSLITRGDELLGLQRGLFAAGAASLLISLWVVNDRTTTDVMTRFYTGYRQGASPAAALRGAQCALLAEDAHPAFWAPFVLGGNP